jgi:UDP-3-O-acyl-N-acetylglucosamine deacetylase
VAVKTVDTYIAAQKLTKVDHIKIDVEGHEVPVLRGAINSLKNCVQHVQFEYNYFWKSSGYTLEEAYSILASAGFNVYRLTPWGKIKIDKFTTKLENYPDASNYIAIKK